MEKLQLSLYKKGIDTEITLQDLKIVVRLLDRQGRILAKGTGDTEEEAMANIVSNLLVPMEFEGLSRL